MILWMKVVHILAMTAWMAGLFYLPRLFVYHVRQQLGSETDLVFKTMEDRLLRVIMRPAGLVTIASGIGLALLSNVGFSETWFVVKLGAVAAMVGFHGLLESFSCSFAKGRRSHSERYFRVLNEVPTVLLVVIVVAVIVRPYS